jgi:hypothetical protein
VKRRALRGLSICVALGATACAEQGEPLTLEWRDDPIVYGSDDRKDVYQVDDEALRDLARWSLVALVPHNRMARPQTGGVTLVAPLLSEMKFATESKQLLPLCASEPFRSQPAAADCTGVLIDDDLVLTAGHCFEDDQGCEDFAYVFDYFAPSENTLETLSSSDVYSCRKLLARKVSDSGSLRQVDFALVRLDRPALGRRAVNIRTSPLKLNEPLTAIGFPSGLPAKIDQGARVIDARTAMHDYFLLNSDTFAGSSGSGIFDADNALLGVLVRGGYDFVVSPDNPSCVVSSVVSDEPGAMHDWEEATYATQALDSLCGAGYPSERLCGTKGSCGDHYCSLREDADTCAQDCSGERNKAQDPQVVGEPDPVVEDAGGPAAADSGAAAPGEKTKKPAACSASSAALESSAGLTVWLSALALMLRRRRRSEP